MKNNEKKPFQKMKKAIFLKTGGVVVLMAATTAILMAMAACKGTPTTPTTPTTPFVDTFGTLVGSFNGVDAYSNRVKGYVSNQANFYNGVNTGMKWQCTEYVQRYYLQIYNMYINPNDFGPWRNFYYLGESVGLLPYPNGGSVAPQVGDIICSGNGEVSGSGHVAIVREVGSNYINVIQQNWNNSSLDNSQTLSRDGNHVDPFNLSYPIVGWLRKPGGSDGRNLR